ncbi:hypothetical protein E2562_029746 [Oryza meyeriana var. granulata]|uniref:Leucine-rich repeat-containing N-terminal plant-type domain-containing protein n=1 Tax=Oryza meyeriana var. granulata TaxID=110450 RepID=A0A6G1CJ96_9ORYZ|nr:hypothetical protein E2562_029746 [Oryza meyeriana var. granulata]
MRVMLNFKAVVTTDPGAVLANWTLGGDPCSDFGGVSCDPVFGAVQWRRLCGTGLEGMLFPVARAAPRPGVRLALREPPLHCDPDELRRAR